MTTYGYIRTSRAQELRHVGSDPEAQRKQLLNADVDPHHIFADVGTSGTSGVGSRTSGMPLTINSLKATY